jgi:Mrp family chromosome partitioning ATPase
MQELLSDQKKQVDWVIVDGPPLAAFPDGHVLASLTDGIVVVVGAGETQAAAIDGAVTMLGRERIFGVVLNRASASSTAYYYERQKPTQGLLQRCSRFFCRA